MDATATLELLLRGAAAGSQVGLGLALARSASSLSLRAATLLFITANVAFLLNSSADIRQAIGPATHLLWFLQVGGAGLLWLFIITLFEDRPISVRTLAPVAVLYAIALSARLTTGALESGLWAIHNLVGLGVAVHAMLVMLRSRREDLVEERRRLRVPTMAAIAGYSALLSLAQIGQYLGYDARWYGFADALAQAALGVLGILALMRASEFLFGKAEGAPSQADGDLDRLWIERLDEAMKRDMLWRREGLTIGELADVVGLPEHRLRRLINDRLGHRNFPSFINQQRIAAAKDILADPANARRSVASIAFDLGFGSLGPFNRAFRDETGLTPTDYRRKLFAKASPILEKTD